MLVRRIAVNKARPDLRSLEIEHSANTPTAAAPYPEDLAKRFDKASPGRNHIVGRMPDQFYRMMKGDHQANIRPYEGFKKPPGP